MADVFFSAHAHASTDEGCDTGESAAEVDREDIQKSLDGDGEAYRRLVVRHQDRVASLMWRFSRDHSVHVELVQDVFVEAYLSLRSYRGQAPFSHWLTAVATRRGYRYWKLKTRQRDQYSLDSLGIAMADERPGGSVDEISASEAAEMLHRLFERLPPHDRLVLTLRYLDECTTEETARRTGWSRARVKVRCWRAVRKLRRILEKMGERT